MRRLFQPVLGIVFGTTIAWAFFPRVETLVLEDRPTEEWFEVDFITVADTLAGASPIVEVNRQIHQPFSADWTVTLRKQQGAGFAVYCTRHGRSDYRPGATLPDSTTLDWWMAVPPNLPCPYVEPGNYVVTIAWTLEIPNRPLKYARITSNIFEVKA